MSAVRYKQPVTFQVLKESFWRGADAAPVRTENQAVGYGGTS